MRTLLLFLSITLSTIFYSHAKNALLIQACGKSEIYNYAEQELKSFLGKDYRVVNSGPVFEKIILTVNKQLKTGSFSVSSFTVNNQHVVTLSGSNESSMLDAVYTFLEKAGFRFEITGPVIPNRIDLQKIKNYTEVINPLVLQRGIRQHLNFPMDISSYPLEEAKEYVRNLARLRFNYIVFHSYPGEWYEVPGGDSTNKYAGHFFYGQRYDIPDNPKIIREKVRNKTVYCIPSIEPYYDQPQVRGRMAEEWLQSLMKECKRVGLTVCFSFEPRSASVDVSKTVETVKSILNLYPDINELQLITEEASGYQSNPTAKEIEENLTKHFGSDALNDRILTSPIRDGQRLLAYLYAQIGHNIKAYNAITTTLLKPKNIQCSLGLYVGIAEYLKPCYHLLEKYAPGVSYAVLPAYGSRMVAQRLPQLNMTRNNWDKTTIFSWMEFDGVMYLQQNQIRGIRQLIEYGEDVNGAGNQIKAICFNHWRTAENRVVIKYASITTLYGSKDEHLFYTDYAKSCGIKHEEVFNLAMKQIDAACYYASTNLGNVGFCFAGVWGKGFGYFGGMNREKLIIGRGMYEKALSLLQQCGAGVTTNVARQYLAFMDNRLRTTIIYLKAFEKGTELQQINLKKDLSAEERKRVASICNQSILSFEQYLEIYAQKMPDRGCEGTIVSIYNTPIAILKRIRYEVGGIPYTDKPASDKGIDAPPQPIVFDKGI